MEDQHGVVMPDPEVKQELSDTNQNTCCENIKIIKPPTHKMIASDMYKKSEEENERHIQLAVALMAISNPK